MTSQAEEAKQGEKAAAPTSIRVWDIPVRLFHWALVITVSTSLYTGLFGGFGAMDYHMLAGYTVVGLVLFRVIWGFLGSRYARFTSFVRPTAVISYGKTMLKRDSAPSAGHNPMGGLSVVALLVVLTIQAGTGLFANDDIFLEGPLTHLVSDDTSDLLTSIHHLTLYALYGLIGLHLSAIAFYEIYKRQRLILPMITGRKNMQGEAEGDSSPWVNLGKGITCGLVAAGAVYYLLNHI